MSDMNDPLDYMPTRLTQPCIPPGSLNRVPALIGWGETVKAGNVTSTGWQVTLRDPIWHVNSRSGEACFRTAIFRLLYVTVLILRVNVFAVVSACSVVLISNQRHDHRARCTKTHTAAALPAVTTVRHQLYRLLPVPRRYLEQAAQQMLR